MKRACNWAIGSSLAVYYAVACAGYSVFGDTDANVLGRKMPDDILTGFDGPRWIILLSNVAVLVHMLPAYQVWSQPFFEFFEHWRDRKAELAGRDPWGLSPMRFRFALRTSYVVAGTLVTCAIPSEYSSASSAMTSSCAGLSPPNGILIRSMPGASHIVPGPLVGLSAKGRLRLSVPS